MHFWLKLRELEFSPSEYAWITYRKKNIYHSTNLSHIYHQYIQLDNHSGDFQQDLHRSLRSDMDSASIRWCLQIEDLEFNNSIIFFSVILCVQTSNPWSKICYLLFIRLLLVSFSQKRVWCHFYTVPTYLTVGSSVSRFTITAVTSNEINTGGTILAWIRRAFVDVCRLKIDKWISNNNFILHYASFRKNPWSNICYLFFMRYLLVSFSHRKRLCFFCLHCTNLFHSYFQYIQICNHSGDFQQDPHTWLHSGMD